jgi:hypothetical protein
MSHHLPQATGETCQLLHVLIATLPNFLVHENYSQYCWRLESDNYIQASVNLHCVRREESEPAGLPKEVEEV